MTNELPNCPQCHSTYTYEDGAIYICPECAFEWAILSSESKTETKETEFTVKDSNGTQLKDGDSVVLIKDLKVKGSSSPVKRGTVVKNIRLVNSDHNIDCKVEGFGAMGLKSEFVKKL